MNHANGISLDANRDIVQVVSAKTDVEHLRPMALDPTRHVLLCEELKHLYVAITRAKNSLVIFDTSRARRAPFFHLMQRLGLAQLAQRFVSFLSIMGMPTGRLRYP